MQFIWFCCIIFVAHFAWTQQCGAAPVHNSLYRAYNDALPAPLFPLLERDVLAVSEWELRQPALPSGKRRTRWLPIGQTPKTALEEAVLHLAEIAKPDISCIGYEWWIQRIKSHEPLGFHVDKDESIATHQMRLVHPLWSSVFYVTDIGGGTLITDQFSPEGNGYVPEQPTEGSWSFPKKNKYLVFNGTLLHGVIKSDHSIDPAAGRERITFLINYWPYKPELPNCDYLDHQDVPGLTLLSRAELKSLREEVEEWKETQKAQGAKNHKPIREALATVDLTPGTIVDHFPFTIQLPGDRSQRVTLPRITSPGKTYQLRWVKKSPSPASKPKSSSTSRKTTKSSSRSEDQAASTRSSIPNIATSTSQTQHLSKEEKLARAKALKEELKRQLHADL